MPEVSIQQDSTLMLYNSNDNMVLEARLESVHREIEQENQIPEELQEMNSSQYMTGCASNYATPSQVVISTANVPPNTNRNLVQTPTNQHAIDTSNNLQEMKDKLKNIQSNK